jgi:phosphoglycerol transferase MdoB-like AlkP superfamily enzyme
VFLEWKGPWMAQRLKEKGFRTAYFSASNLKFAEFGLLVQASGYDVVSEPLNYSNAQQLSSWGGDEESNVKAALKWIDAADDKTKQQRPFFLTILTNAAHHPYATSAQFQKHRNFSSTEQEDSLEKYRQSVQYADYAFGLLIQGLRERGFGLLLFVCCFYFVFERARR